MLLIDMLGRRFESADRSIPDVTLVAYDAQAKTARLHVLGGDRQTVDLDIFARAVDDGVLLEAKAAPFVHDRESRFDRDRRERGNRIGVAGQGKSILRLVVGSGRWEKF